MSHSDTVTLELSPEVYIARVAAALSHVPTEERLDLLSGVGEHLDEVAREGGDLVSRLGTPEEYAHELIVAAGITDQGRSEGWLHSVWASEPIRRIRSAQWVSSVTTFVPELRPAWWVLRGYLVVVVLAQAMNDWGAWWHALPIIPSVENGPFGLLLVIIGICASVAIGRRRFGAAGRTVLICVNIVLITLASYAFLQINDRLGSAIRASDYPSAVPTPSHPNSNGLRLNGAHVTNIFPYDASGLPLTGVQLFDQNGRPIALRRDHIGGLRVVRVTDEFGRRLNNVFPAVIVDRNDRPLNIQHQDIKGRVPAIKQPVGNASTSKK